MYDTNPWLYYIVVGSWQWLLIPIMRWSNGYFLSSSSLHYHLCLDQTRWIKPKLHHVLRSDARLDETKWRPMHSDRGLDDSTPWWGRAWSVVVVNNKHIALVVSMLRLDSFTRGHAGKQMSLFPLSRKHFATATSYNCTPCSSCEHTHSHKAIPCYSATKWAVFNLVKLWLRQFYVHYIYSKYNLNFVVLVEHIWCCVFR